MVSNKDRRFIAMALKLALGCHRQHRLGAIVVKGGRILGKGFNVFETRRCAEERALDDNWRSELEGATLYVARATRVRACGIARPCAKCQNLIRSLGIGKVFFTTDDPLNPIAMERFV